MKEIFIAKRFSKANRDMITVINSILDEYEQDGYDLSLRQLYYQLVARAFIDNSIQSYKKIGNLVNDARLAGLIDWDMIKDRGRRTVSNSHWDSPLDIIDQAARQFEINKWIDQQNHIEVMVEKQALEGVLIPVCSSLDVNFTANKGYSSASTFYEIGKRLETLSRYGKDIWVLYLGDHDPSGIDMTRDVFERLELFAQTEIHINRLALNYEQVIEWNPPENPAKDTDSRYAQYRSQFGDASWELDAIEPRVLAQLVRDAVVALRDDTLWDEAVAREEELKTNLREMKQLYKEHFSE